jgi:hypothetical protein
MAESIVFSPLPKIDKKLITFETSSTSWFSFPKYFVEWVNLDLGKRQSYFLENN